MKLTNRSLLFSLVLASFIGFVHTLNATHLVVEAVSNKQPLASERSIPSFGALEITFSNGIKVCLKPTDIEEDEILIHGFAPGGYGSVDPAQRASAQLSAAIAWESGIGAHSAQELTQFLYDENMELNTSVGYCSHSIEGCSGSKSFPKLLKTINEIFMAPHFDKELVPKLIDLFQESARIRSVDPEAQFEDAIKMLNSENNPSFRPLKESEIATIDYQIAEHFYRTQFLNPKGYTFVIIGDFDIETMRPLVTKWLGSIPPQPPALTPVEKPIATFPKGIVRQFLPVREASENLTNITFNLKLSEPFNLRLLETMTQVIETRLRQAFTKEVGSTQGIDVALELPLHPSQNPLWLSLQFRSTREETKRLIFAALRELQLLQRSGPTPEDTQTALMLQDYNDVYWESDNSYWLALLSNHYQLGLNLDQQPSDREQSQESFSTIIENLLRTSLDLTNYTIVTTGQAQE